MWFDANYLEECLLFLQLQSHWQSCKVIAHRKQRKQQFSAETLVLDELLSPLCSWGSKVQRWADVLNTTSRGQIRCGIPALCSPALEDTQHGFACSDDFLLLNILNHLGWKRPLRSSSPTVNLTPPTPPLNRVPKCYDYVSFKHLQG